MLASGPGDSCILDMAAIHRSSESQVKLYSKVKVLGSTGRIERLRIEDSALGHRAWNISTCSELTMSRTTVLRVAVRAYCRLTDPV
jgi:hypothetical protein